MLNPNKNNSLYEIEWIGSYKEEGYVKLSKHICLLEQMFLTFENYKMFNQFGNIHRFKPH